MTRPCCTCGNAFAVKSAKSTSRFCSRRCWYDFRTAPLVSRFWGAVDKRGPDECWPWMAARKKRGYGAIRLGPDRDSRQEIAHRVSWEIHNGPIPEGLDILHSCDNPPCCNPRHLRPGTKAANARDCVERGRSLRGMRHNQAKVSDCDVQEIRLGRQRGRSIKELAAEFGLSYGHTKAIASGRARAYDLSDEARAKVAAALRIVE